MRPKSELWRRHYWPFGEDFLPHPKGCLPEAFLIRRLDQLKRLLHAHHMPKSGGLHLKNQLAIKRTSFVFLGFIGDLTLAVHQMGRTFLLSTASLWGWERCFSSTSKARMKQSHILFPKKENTRESPRFQAIQEALSCKISFVGFFSITESMKNYQF